MTANLISFGAIDLMDLLGKPVGEAVPGRITPDQAAILQAGGPESPSLSKIRRAADRGIKTGHLALVEEIETYEFQPTRTHRIDRTPLHRIDGQVAQYRQPVFIKFQTGPKETRTRSRKWVTRDAARAWLKSIGVEPSPAMAFWLQSKSEAASISPRERIRKNHQRWHAEITRLMEEERLGLTDARERVARQAGCSLSTVEKADQKLRKTLKETRLAKKTNPPSFQPWFPQPKA